MIDSRNETTSAWPPWLATRLRSSVHLNKEGNITGNITTSYGFKLLTVNQVFLLVEAFE